MTATDFFYVSLNKVRTLKSMLRNDADNIAAIPLLKQNFDETKEYIEKKLIPIADQIELSEISKEDAEELMYAMQDMKIDASLLEPVSS